MRAQSKKRRAEKSKRAAVVEAALARDKGCKMPGRVALFVTPDLIDVVGLLDGYNSHCAGPLDPHEIIPRSAWPGGHLVLSNVVMLCRRHHDWVSNYPTEAHRLGLHGYSWERPADTQRPAP